MKFHTHRDKPIVIHLTSLQGYIQATHEQLISAFGRPELGTVKDDFFSHWMLEFTDGTVATIYDRHRDNPPGDSEIIDWYIGGRSRRAAELVHDAFREDQQLLARTAA